MSVIGISFWGILADFDDHRFITLDSPDGHRYGRPMLVKELLRHGHQVIQLQQSRGMLGGYSCEHGAVKHDPIGLPDVDIIFMEYRWPTWKNDRNHPDHQPSRYEPDLDRQLEILQKYHGEVPIIVWDTDLKITPEFEKMWPEVVIADPSFETNRLTCARLSVPFWTDFKELLPVAEPYPLYGYIGNNYERSDEFKRFYFDVKARWMGIQTSMYGNWLQRSPERADPGLLIMSNHGVAFNHRMGFYDSMVMMNRFVCTTHVSKPRYYETGFMSPRYLEALAVNCPALVPEAFKLSTILGKRWIVRDSRDVVARLSELKGLTLDQRHEVMHEQCRALQAFGRFDVRDVVGLIESYAV